jgi:hypothetical protein
LEAYTVSTRWSGKERETPFGYFQTAAVNKNYLRPPLVLATVFLLSWSTFNLLDDPRSIANRTALLLDLLFRKHSYMKLIGLKDCFYRHINTEISKTPLSFPCAACAWLVYRLSAFPLCFFHSLSRHVLVLYALNAAKTPVSADQLTHNPHWQMVLARP